MTEWKRVDYLERCGLCGRSIYENQPAQFLTIANVKRRKIRCVDCVGPAPPDLPERIALSPRTRQFQPIKRTVLGFTRAKLSETDWTNRILGERE